MAELEKFNLECLERVNELRRQFKVPPVKLRLTLIQRTPQMDSYNGAQDWADNLARNDFMQSDGDAARNDIGESICRMFSEKFNTFSGGAVINAWFDEAVEYQGPLVEEKIIHPVNFLQLIWSRTRYCGFGFAVSHNTSAMYSVARFKPILPFQNEILVAGVNQQVLKFDSVNGSAAFKNTIAASLSQDTSYVKRNLCCSVPDVANGTDTLVMRSARYRLSHLVRQTHVSSRNCRQQTGFVYTNEQMDYTNDKFVVMNSNV